MTIFSFIMATTVHINIDKYIIDIASSSNVLSYYNVPQPSVRIHRVLPCWTARPRTHRLEVGQRCFTSHRKSGELAWMFQTVDINNTLNQSQISLFGLLSVTVWPNVNLKRFIVTVTSCFFVFQPKSLYNINVKILFKSNLWNSSIFVLEMYTAGQKKAPMFDDG